MSLAREVPEAGGLVARRELAGVHASRDRLGDVDVARHGGDSTRAQRRAPASRWFSTLLCRSAALQKGTLWVYEQRPMSRGQLYRCWREACFGAGRAGVLTSVSCSPSPSSARWRS